MKATEVVAKIKKRYALPEWTTLTEVMNYDGPNIRRVDVISINMWPSRKYEVHGFEVKVSRADFLNEMKDIKKSETFSKFCDFWWLATPKGLVQPSEVPESWGLLEFTENRTFTTKQAPRKETPEPLDRTFIVSMLKGAISLEEKEIYQKVREATEKERKWLEEREKEILEEAYQKVINAEARTNKHTELLERFQKMTGEEYISEYDMGIFQQKYKMVQALSSGSMFRVLEIMQEIAKIKKGMEGLNGNE